MKRIALIILLFACANGALASVMPESGWWYNPAQPGSGFNIEVQNNTLFVATFAYANDGAPVWYSGAAPMAAGDATVTLQVYDSGQCLGCAYTSPVSKNSPYTAVFSFSDGGHGSVKIAGGSYPIERLNFGYGLGSSTLKGQWIISVLSPAVSGLGLSDFIYYNELISGGGTKGASLMGSGNARVASPVDPQTGAFVAIADLGQNKLLASMMTMTGLNKALGFSAIVYANETGSEMLQKIKSQAAFTVWDRNNRAPQSSQTATVAQVAGPSIDLTVPMRDFAANVTPIQIAEIISQIQ